MHGKPQLILLVILASQLVAPSVAVAYQDNSEVAKRHLDAIKSRGERQNSPLK